MDMIKRKREAVSNQIAKTDNFKPKTILESMVFELKNRKK